MSKPPSPFRSLKYRGKSRLYFTVDLGRPRFNEIDSYHVLWNGHYVTYFEEARMAMLRHFKVSLSQIAESGFYFPIYKMSYQMRKPILEGDSILGAIRMETVDDVVLRFHQLLKVNDETRALATVDHMLTDAQTMDAILSPPPEAKALFAPMVSQFLQSSEGSIENGK